MVLLLDNYNAKVLRYHCLIPFSNIDGQWKLQSSWTRGTCTILAIIFWQFAVFPCKFDSPPQIKRVLISNLTRVDKHNLISSLPYRNQFLVIAAKNWIKTDVNVFLSRPILLIFFTFRYIFCQGFIPHSTKSVSLRCYFLLVTNLVQKN